jgi:hypothetical protein
VITKKTQTTKTKRKKKRGHAWSRRARKNREPSVPKSKNCEPSVLKPTPFEVVTKNIHVPTPTSKHKTKPKCKKKHDHGRKRNGRSTPSKSCEDVPKKIRYQFFRSSYPINSPRPTVLRQINLSETLGAPIYEVLTSNEIDHEINPPKCLCRNCPYSTGDHRHQIRLLLHRLHELLLFMNK